ncbi:hypothetical protein [Halocatena halophila]|uniref:hypothetical protein n=1 Tax=Halocatena halophila TaxID=2814576 RepID=UPI002ED31217
MSSSADSSTTSIDPTRTQTLRERYSSRLRGGYGAINAQLRKDISERDVFGLDENGNEQLAVPTNPPNAGGNFDPEPLAVSGDTRLSRQVEAFITWLHRQQRRGVLGPISRQYNSWLVEAYNRGVTQAGTDLRQLGVEPADVPSSRRNQTIDEATARHYTNLEGVIGAVETETSKELNEALIAGVAAYLLLRRLTDRIKKIGKTRASTHAHSAVVRTYNEGLLDRYEASGVQRVGAEIELEVSDPSRLSPEDTTSSSRESKREKIVRWLTAGDLKVCPECRALQGRTWPISEIRAGKAPLPVRDTHYRCRCRLVPDIRDATTMPRTYDKRR